MFYKRVKIFFNSLKNRFFFSAILMIFILLPLVGFIISQAYEKHMIESIKNELSAYSFSILAVMEVENKQLLIPQYLAETQFNVSQSGLYAVVTPLRSTLLNSSINAQLAPLWSSQSFLAKWQAANYQYPAIGQNQLYQVTIDQKKHFVYSFSVSFGDEFDPYPLTLHIIKQRTQLDTMMAEFHYQLLLGLSGLLLFLLLFQYLWSLWTLKPLQLLQQEVQQVEQGEKAKLLGTYPTELLNITQQLNLLLTTEQKQRQRYRNALSDLAHSLKTPLAVIQSQQQLSNLTQEQINIINVMIDHQLRKAQSAAESSWHLGCAISPVVEKLISSLAKIYQDKNIDFQRSINQEVIFKGDEADLLEILGNLLDNAFKAANSKVALTIIEQQQQISFIIEDDGCGISENQREDILKRGTRADTYQHGHGIGLAIVRDLVKSYQGTIDIGNSVQLKGAKFTIQFAK